MVKISSASIRVEDTARVELENEGVSLNGNGDGAVSDGSLKGNSAVGGNSGVSGGLYLGDLGGVINAGTVLSGVRVVSSVHHTVVLSVLEGRVHFTTVAAHVTVGATSAVNELLL